MLVTVALFVPPVSAWLRAHNDAGDWIAFGAAIVAAVSWWQAKRSADASNRSAKAAEDMLPVARSSADAAVDSARAAHRSADAAEAQRWRDDAPDWQVSIAPKGQRLRVTVTMMSGPAALYATHFYMGKIWPRGQSASHDPDPGLSLNRTLAALEDWLPMKVPRPPITKGGVIEFTVGHSDVPDIGRASITVMVASVEFQRASEQPPPKPWIYAEEVRWQAPAEPLIAGR